MHGGFHQGQQPTLVNDRGALGLGSRVLGPPSILTDHQEGGAAADVAGNLAGEGVGMKGL